MTSELVAPNIPQTQADATRQQPNPGERSRSRHFVWRDGLTLLGITALTLGLVLPWLTTALGAQSMANDLHVRLPGWYWLDGVTYADILIAAIAIAGVSAAIDIASRYGNRLASKVRVSYFYRCAGALALLCAIGFLLQLLVTDGRAALSLQSAQSDLGQLTSQFTYRIPQPQLKQLLFVPLTEPQGLVASALRLGWLLTLLGGVVLCMAPVRRPATADDHRRRWDRYSIGPCVGIVLVAVFAYGLVRGAAADLVASDAASLAAAGQYSASAARYADALSLNPDLSNDPSVAAGAGRARTLSGLPGEAGEAYATAYDQVAANNELEAIATLRAASLHYPENPLLSVALAQVATELALREKDPAVLRSQEVPETVLVLFTRGRLEVAAGELDAGIADLRLATAKTDNADIQSAALTYVSIAQATAGDLITARRTIQDALAADQGRYNVVARAIAAGLYAGVRS